MTWLNFNKQCGASITLKTIYGLIVKEYQCSLINGHNGPHQDKDGTIFVNTERHLDHGRIEAY